jgi:hypothetical protein
MHFRCIFWWIFDIFFSKTWKNECCLISALVFSMKMIFTEKYFIPQERAVHEVFKTFIYRSSWTLMPANYSWNVLKKNLQQFFLGSQSISCKGELYGTLWCPIYTSYFSLELMFVLHYIDHQFSALVCAREGNRSFKSHLKDI